MHAARVARTVPLRDLAPAFRDLPHLAVLEGASDLAREGRWSYLVADPVGLIRWGPDGVSAPGGRGEHDGFAALGALLASGPPAAHSDLPPFWGGAVGYVAYDVGYVLESLPGRCPGPPPAGYLWAGVYDWVLAREGADVAAWIVASGRGGRDPDRLIEAVRQRLRPAQPATRPSGLGLPRSDTDRSSFTGWVRTIKEYIAAGDCYQVNIARRISLPCRSPGLELFRLLARAHPAPLAAYLDAGGLEIASSSPELFLRLNDRSAYTRPIKGTRPRGGSPDEDARLELDLRASPKDRAENVMIVDVLRNDLGRVCRPGSVRVPQLWVTEGHPSVWQLVSEVRGELRDGATAADLLRACLPGGSVTGAPKIRAMEIIDELEPVRRGVYCGSVFALGFDGSLASSVAIRTLQLAQGVAQLHVGGGIVADSDPELEYEETVDKARGLLSALGLGE